MNVGEKQINEQEEIKRPENFKQRSVESFESEQDIEKLGEKRISELGAQESGLKQGWQGRAESFNKAIGLSSEKLNSLKEKFGLNEKLAGISEKGAAYLGEAKTKIVEISKTKEFNQIADATPFVGGAKRVAESVYGKTLSGEELSGKNRLKHGVRGAVDFGLDFTGVGEVEKGAKMAYVGKKIATGPKDNPEALANLGKKIVRNKEPVAQGSKEANMEVDFLKSEENDERWKKDVLKGLVPEKKKTIETEVEDFNKWQEEQKKTNKSPDEIRDEITKRTIKGENIGDILKDVSKNNPKSEGGQGDNFQRPSDKLEQFTKQKKDHRFTIEKQIPLDVENILPHNKLNNNENNMKFETTSTDSKETQSEKPKAEKSAEELFSKHGADGIAKFDKMVGIFEKSRASEEVQRENFKNLGMEDLYEKHLEKRKTDGENTKAIERKKVLNSKVEQYKSLDNVAGVKIGTLAYAKKVNELIQLAKERGNYTQLKGQTSEEAHQKLEEDLQKRLEANADILQAKKEMIEPRDFERIQGIDDEGEKVDEEIKNQMRDTNNVDFSGRIELEKQNDKLREERTSIESKYKGMGGI